MNVRFCWHYDPFSFFVSLKDSPGCLHHDLFIRKDWFFFFAEEMCWNRFAVGWRQTSAVVAEPPAVNNSRKAVDGQTTAVTG